MTGSSHLQTELSTSEAFGVAHGRRKQLRAGAETLERLPTSGTEEVYRRVHWYLLEQNRAADTQPWGRWRGWRTAVRSLV